MLDSIPPFVLQLEMAALAPALLRVSRRWGRWAIGTRCERTPPTFDAALRRLADRGTLDDPQLAQMFEHAARTVPAIAPLDMATLGTVKKWCDAHGIDRFVRHTLEHTALMAPARSFFGNRVAHDDLASLAASVVTGDPVFVEAVAKWARAQLRIEATWAMYGAFDVAPLHVDPALVRVFEAVGPVRSPSLDEQPHIIDVNGDREHHRIVVRAYGALDARSPMAMTALDLNAALRGHARALSHLHHGATYLLDATHAALAELFSEPLPRERELMDDLFKPAHEKLFDQLAAWGSERAVKQQETGTVWWRVVAAGRRFRVEPVERKARAGSKTTKWTKGRVIDAWDLSGIPAATPRDREAAGLESRGLCPLVPLVNAPNVIDDAGNAIVVERATLAVGVDEVGDDLRLVCRLGTAPIDTLRLWEDGRYRLQQSDVLAGWDVAAQKLYVARLGPAELRLLQLIADAGPVPKTEAPRLLSALENVAAHIAVELPAALEGATTEADRAIVVRLAAAGENGVKVRIGVRPVPGGDVVDAGGGSEILAGVVDGRRVRYRRSLELELQDADALRARVFPDADDESAPVTWERVLLDEDALFALERIEDARLASIAPGYEGPRLDVEATSDLVQVTRPMTPEQTTVRASRFDDFLGIAGDVTPETGLKVDLASALAALRMGRKYVRVGAKKFARIGEELEARLRLLADATVATTSGAVTLPVELAFALEALEESGANISGDEFWNGVRDQVQTGRDVDGTPSPAVNAQLRPYQEDGVRFLRRLAAWGVGGVLADDMGLGKTLQSIVLLADRASRGPQLVVVPTSVAFNWAREIERFAPSLRVRAYEGDRTTRQSRLVDLGPNDIVIASYALITRDIEALGAVKFATVVFDEAHAIKNPSTQRARAVRKLQADWRFALSGTPLENKTMELWSLFTALAPGLLGSSQTFAERFANPIEGANDVERRRALSRVVRPFLLRRKKSEVALDLPARTDLTLLVEPTPYERNFYLDVRNTIVAWMSEPPSDDPEALNDRRFRALVSLNKLRVAACAPVMAGGEHSEATSKTTALLERLEELKASGNKALVFSQFTRHLDLVEDAARSAGFTTLRLDGSTAPGARMDVVDKFQRGEADVMFLSVKAGGVGLNLTRASYVFHMDPWWNPAVEEQATGRAHRIGQTEPVTAIRLVARGTIEEAILRMHADKRDLVDGVLEGSEAAASLTYDEIKELVLMGTEEVSAPTSVRKKRR
jgi:superfamily II DNA or RNA helicase